MANEISNFGFVLGVTGHRDISVTDTESLEILIDQLLEELRTKLGTFPLTVACGLADGADRIVAVKALAKGIPVLAVLPMPREDYIEDFSEVSLQEFDSLLSNKNVSVIELPLPPKMVLSKENFARDQAYAGLRDWLVQRSNLILGLWAGTPNRPEGGTTDVLLSYLCEQESPKKREGIVSLEFKETGTAPHGANIAAWIEVGRRDSHEVNPSLTYLSPSFRKTVLIRTSEMPAPIHQRLAGLKEHANACSNLDRANENAQRSSLLKNIPEDLSPSLKDSLRKINEQFLAADSLAVEEQNRSNWLFKSFGLLAATMGFLFLLYAKLVPTISVVILYLALFAGAFALFGQVGKKVSFTRYLAHRVIAESLRIQFYMMLAGTENKNKFTQLKRLSGIESISGFVWLNDVLKDSETFRANDGTTTNAALLFVKKSWIDAQLSYFTDLVTSLSSKTRKLGQVKTALMCMNLSLLTVLIIFSDELALLFFAENITLKSFLVFLIGLIPLWVGIWELYQNKMATRELLWQYKNQAEHFQEASSKLENNLSKEAIQKIIIDLAERSLFENYQWTLRRYHRESEPSPTLFGTTGMAMFQGRVGAAQAKLGNEVRRGH